MPASTSRPTPPLEPFELPGALEVALEPEPPFDVAAEVRPRTMRRLLLDELWEALLPQRCIVCRKFGAALHARCVALLPRADGVRCDRCWRPLEGLGVYEREEIGLCHACIGAPSFVEAKRAAFRFEGRARRAILEAKFRRVSSLLPPLAEAAALAVPREWAIEAVVPVPLHSGRQRRRGFNQAEVIGDAVAAVLGVPLQARWLRRARPTAPQAGLDAAARGTNLEGAFATDRREILEAGRGANVLLVDDVTTTGATFEAAARALAETGMTNVYALALARED